MIIKVKYVIFPLLCFWLSSPSLALGEKCDKPSGWYAADQPVPEPGYYISIKVKENNYYTLEGANVKEKALIKALSHAYAYKENYEFVSGYLYLTSYDNFSCDRYRHAADIIDRSFHCTEDRKCVWAYGVGSKQPSNIPEPLDR